MKDTDKARQAIIDALGTGVASVSQKSKPDDAFAADFAEFAAALFKNSSTAGENHMVSPLSVMLALAMAMNGAKGETLAQMERVLGGSMNCRELNRSLCAFVRGLTVRERAQLHAANSMWLREGDIRVSAGFIRACEEYYGSEVRVAPFDGGTVRDINRWVNQKTDGMIHHIIQNIPDDARMFLINALAFEAEWDEIYQDTQIYDDTFHGVSGDKKVSMMSSTEWEYLSDGRATGFIKPYAGGYSFAALLPNEDVSIGEYIAAMNGGALYDTLQHSERVKVIAKMPKFKAEYSVEMRDVLENMGMTQAFDPDKANFLGIDDSQPLYIGSVLHKTFINVDERGTKAGAVTAVMVACGCAMPAPEEIRYVTLDRPFVYMVIDNATRLPIFIGALMN